MIAKSRRDKSAACAIWDAVKDIKENQEILVPKEMKDSHYKTASILGHGGYHDGKNPEMYVGINKKYYKPEKWEYKP
jgi:putative ATPase